jgi:signal transduction histidine kinase
MDRKIQPVDEEKIELNQIPAGIIITDETGVVHRFNSYAEELTGGRCRGRARIGDFLDMDKTRTMISGEFYNVTASPYREGDFRGTIYIIHSLEAVLQEESETKIREASEMVAEIAHEIRNPLGSIELFASLLKKTMAGDKDLKRIGQIILSVKAINERISELLQMSKKRALRKRIFSLSRLIHELVGMPGQAESFLTFHTNSRDMAVEGDEKMLRQMFLNLLIQVLQVMPPEARLTVEASRQTQKGKPYGGVSFTCEGEGTLFTHFDLAMGLNLAIIHNITHMHNGIVDIGRNAISILLPVNES